MIYAWKCPILIKGYRNFSEFRAAHTGFADLTDMFQHLLFEARAQKPRAISCLGAFVILVRNHHSVKERGDTPDLLAAIGKSTEEVPKRGDTVPQLIYSLMRHISPFENIMNDLFDVCVEHESSLKPGWARASQVLFMIGGVLAFVLVAQNAWAVLKTGSL